MEASGATNSPWAGIPPILEKWDDRVLLSSRHYRLTGSWFKQGLSLDLQGRVAIKFYFIASETLNV